MECHSCACSRGARVGRPARTPQLSLGRLTSAGPCAWFSRSQAHYSIQVTLSRDIRFPALLPRPHSRLRRRAFACAYSSQGSLTLAREWPYMSHLPSQAPAALACIAQRVPVLAHVPTRPYAAASTLGHADACARLSRAACAGVGAMPGSGYVSLARVVQDRCAGRPSSSRVDARSEGSDSGAHLGHVCLYGRPRDR